MTVHDATLVALAVAVLGVAIGWLLTKMASPLNFVFTWLVFAFFGWGVFVLVSTVVART